jgi:hypothetical protein
VIDGQSRDGLAINEMFNEVGMKRQRAAPQQYSRFLGSCGHACGALTRRK